MFQLAIYLRAPCWLIGNAMSVCFNSCSWYLTPDLIPFLSFFCLKIFFVLVSVVCSTQYCSLGGLATQQEFISHHSGFWAVRDQLASRSAVLWGPASWFRDAVCSSHGGRGPGALQGLCCKGTNPTRKGSTLLTSWPPKDYLQRPSHRVGLKDGFWWTQAFSL